MTTLAELVVKIGADVSEFAKGMEESQKRLARTADALSSAGRSLTAGVTLPLAGVGIAAIKMSTDFNAAMANVGTLIPGNTQRVEELKKAVQGMAVETGKATQDLAGGLYQVISAFGDTADTVKVLEINAKAAAAGLATTTDAINLTSAVTKGYGDTTATAVQKASDLAFVTVRLGQTTFPELAASIGRVTPLAATLGVKQEELFAAMATGTGVTGGAAEVSTQLRGVLQSLMSPTDSMTKLFGEMGFASGEAMLKQLGLQGTIDAVARAAQDSGKPLQEFISSIEGQTLALALSGPQATSFTEKLKAMTDAAGATDRAFKDQTEGINATGFAWSRFRQKLETTMQALGDQLAPALKDVLDAMQPFVDRLKGAIQWFSQLDDGTKRWVIGLALLAAGLGPVLMSVGLLTQGLIALITVVGGVSTAIGLLTGFGSTLAMAFALWAGGAATFGEALVFALGPVGLVIAAILALIAIGVLLYKNWDTISAWLSQTWESIRQTGETVWNSIKNSATAIWDSIKAFFATWWETLLVVFTGPIGLIALLIIKNWDEIKQTTIDVWNSITDFVSGVWSSISAKATEVFTAIGDFLRSTWEAVRGFLSGIWDGIYKAFDNTFGDMVRSAFDFGKRIMQALKDAIGSVRLPIPTIRLSFYEGPLGIQIPDLDFGVNWRSLKDLVPFLASGGIVRSPTLAMIGEAGPEAVVPLDRMGGGSGGPVTVIIQLDGRQIAQAMLPRMQERMVLKGVPV